MTFAGVCQGAAEDGNKVHRLAGTRMATWENHQRCAQEFGKRDSRALGELALGGRSPSDYEPGRRRL